MKKIIITADDYCATPAINRGIRTAIDKGVINSVAVLMNLPNSKTDLQNLVADYQTKIDNGKLQLGVHLTISSGEPISQNVPSLLLPAPSKKFKPLDELNPQAIDLPELKREIDAQIAAFIQVTGSKPLHLSVHHGTLTLFNNLFDVYIDAAKRINAPIRNPIIISREKIQGFKLWTKMQRTGLFTAFRLFDDNGIDLLWDQNKSVNVKELRKILIDESPDLRSTQHFIDIYYGSGKARRLRRIMKHFPHDHNEMVVHLSDTHTLNELNDVPHGVNPKYFKTRMQELATLTRDGLLSGHMREYRVGWGKWGDL